MIKIKRIYDAYDSEDGYRILIDRLWPRGIKKESANIDLWMKRISPSHELRKWFNHDPSKWEELLTKYELELDINKLREIRILEENYRIITLLFAAKDKEFNNANALLTLLQNSGI